MNMVNYHVVQEPDCDTRELHELKNDEKMALESIYGPAFTEKIPEKVWELR